MHGCPSIDVEDWRRNVDYRGGFHDEHPTIVAFWQVLEEEFTEAQRAATLHFSTVRSVLVVAAGQERNHDVCLRQGSSKVPLEGFAGLRGSGNVCRFTLCKTSEPLDSLPKAHCCFNRLELPDYGDRALLLGKLGQAISMAPGGFELS